MTDKERFLDRWSRRKRAARAERSAEARPEVRSNAGQGLPSTPTDVEPPNPAAPDRHNSPTSREFDPASLPPIDSITAATDIRAFLAREVPLNLTRAALRRAWLADPAIRNFIGPAENAWDFNDPDGVPGFAPLSAQDLKQIVTGLMDTVVPETAAATPEAVNLSTPGAIPLADPDKSNANNATPVEHVRQEIAGSPTEDKQQSLVLKSSAEPSAQNNSECAAVRYEGRPPQDTPAPTRRRHGRAMPE
jgi:hypothetical protein